MDISRFKKTLAGLSVALVMLTQVGTAFAKYSDVPSGVWYEDAVSAFTDAGYLDAAQARFRGGDAANRAEFVKLIVMLNGGLLSTPPAVPSFNDVATGAWYYSYMEESAKEGWVRGDGDCYGSKPCYSRPSANINRAEAAALIVRAFGLESTGAAAQFVDNPSGKWFTEDIQTAADHCVLQGDEGSARVRPGDSMNRAEMVVMLHRVDQGLSYGVDCGGEEGVAVIKSAVATDSVTVEVEFTAEVTKATAENKANYTVSGSPALPINAASLIAKDTVELTLGEEMVPEHEYTVAVKDVDTVGGKTISDTATFPGFTAMVKGDGELEVSVASSNPRGDTIPGGAVGVVMLSTDFTASCKDKVEVENLTVLHEGFGAESDVDGLYAAVNGARVTRKRTLDAQDQTAELRFSSPLVIDPCETVTVDIVADFSSTATVAGEHNFVVELPSDVASNAADVRGNFPLRGETFRMAAVDSGTITISYRSVNPSQVQVGDKGVVIGKFELNADSTEDQTIYSSTFENNSSASDGEYTNIAIRRTDGTVLTNTVAQTVGDFVTLVFDPPFTILEGDKITLEIVADIVNGADKSIQMHFEESSDLFAVGSLYGYGVNGQLYGSQVTIPSDNATTVTIDAGEFTIGINGPSTTQYTSDSNDAVLANVEFTTGGEDVDVKTLYIAVHGQTSTGGYLCDNGGSHSVDTSCVGAVTETIASMMEGVELRNKTTGRTVSGVRETTAQSGAAGTSPGDYGDASTSNRGQYQIYRFDDFVIKGKETWQFRVDFVSNSGTHPRNGDKFRIYVCGEPTHILSAGSLTANTTYCNFGSIFTTAPSDFQMQVEGLSTGDKVGDVRPRGTIAGNAQEVVDASLTVAVKALSTADSAVENSKDVNLLRFEAKASSAEDLLLTKGVFEAQSGSLVNALNYALWVDTDGDRKVDTILEDGVTSQSSQVSFTELAGGGYVLPKEQTVVFEVHGDVSSSLTGDDLQVRFATGTSVTYLEAEKLADGSSLSGLKLNGTCASTCNITVTTVGSTTWYFKNQGDLFVTRDSVIGPRQLLGGTLAESILKLKFHAEYEDIDVTDLVLNSSGGTAGSVESLELWLDGGTRSIATSGGCGSADVLSVNNSSPGPASASGTTAFCFTMDAKQLVVPKGSDLIVNVKPRIKTDVAGGTSAQVVSLFVDHTNTSNDATGTGSVRARGVASSNNLVANDADASAEGEVFIGVTTATANGRQPGSYNQVVMSKFASITNGGAAAGSVPSGSDREIGAFTFTATANSNSKDGLNQATVSGAIFTVQATNVNMQYDGFKIYNKLAQGQNATCTPWSTAGVQATSGNVGSGTFLVRCDRLITGGVVNTAVTQGSSITLVLMANVTNANTAAGSGGSSILQVSLNDFTSVGKKTFSSAASRIEWQDKDSTTTALFDWVEYPETAVNSTLYHG